MTSLPIISRGRLLPEAASLLEMLAASSGPHLADTPADIMRQIYRQMAQALEAAPEGGVKIVDLEGAGLPIRAYLPHLVETDTAVMFYHGGGWVMGDLDTHHSLCTLIASLTRCRVVAVDYRRAPETVFPGAHEDCWRATEFVASSPADLGGPINRIAVAGDSAGAHIACWVEERLDAPSRAGALLLYPLVDCYAMAGGSFDEFAENYLLDRRLLKRFIDDFRPQFDDLSGAPKGPQLQQHCGVPSAPAVILTAALDPLRDQGRKLVAQRANAGGEVYYVEAAGLIHGFSTMRGALPTGDVITRRAIRLFGEAIGVPMLSSGA